MLEVDFAQLSDPGPVRPRNEDYLGYVKPSSPEHVRSHGWLFTLADGVGGQRQGGVASRAAVEEVLGGFRRAHAMESHGPLLTRLVQAANARICETEALAGPAGAGMSSTIVVCALRFDRATIAHVGDSRCYLIRDSKARALTNDHTVANEQLHLGILSKAEAEEANTRHVLSRSLGSNLFVKVEVNEVQVQAGDVLLLCSDGLHGAVSSEEIARTVSRRSELSAAAQDLVASANRQDGSDNVSVQLIAVRSVERIGMYRGRPYKLH
ncbi:MAG TPA: protein phosphatase 2C domain-containing protein [Candidatus Binatia bacterium]|nr:protein phosphatase 2C domain-containing protein [Candidatus Binatia bacterium]